MPGDAGAVPSAHELLCDDAPACPWAWSRAVGSGGYPGRHRSGHPSHLRTGPSPGAERPASGRKWAVRPTPGAPSGAARPLLPDSGPLHTGLTAPPPRRSVSAGSPRAGGLKGWGNEKPPDYGRVRGRAGRERRFWRGRCGCEHRHWGSVLRPPDLRVPVQLSALSADHPLHRPYREIRPAGDHPQELCAPGNATGPGISRAQWHLQGEHVDGRLRRAR